MKAKQIPNNIILMEKFCEKMLIRTRYIFSKMGRILNLHDNDSISKWLAKDNNRLLKKISEKNPSFIQEMRNRNISLINLDAHKNKNASLALMFHFKGAIKNWRNDLEYAHLQMKQEPDIPCRICGNNIYVSQIEYHNQLCIKRVHTKEKTSKVDKRFMEILNKLTKEITSLSRSKGNSAVIKKREFFMNHENGQRLLMNSPLITNKGINRLQDMSRAINEKKQNSTPSMPSRSGQLDFVKEGKFGMNRIVRDDGPSKGDKTQPPKPDDWQKSFQFRTLDSRDKDNLMRKPPLPKERKEEGMVKEKSEQKSEGKINTTTESTPDINKDVVRKEELKRMETPIAVIEQSDSIDKKIVEKGNIEDSIKAFDSLNIPDDTNKAMNSRANVSFTPGVNKRRLKRDTNNTIDSFNKSIVSIGALPEISLTKPRDPLKGSEPADDGGNLKANPLMKFCNPIDRESKDKSKSLLGSFMQSDRVKSDDNQSKAKQSSSSKDIYLVDPIPEFRRNSVVSLEPEDFKEKDVKKKPEEKESSTKDASAKKKLRYAQQKKCKILSVIHEEHKVLGEYIPCEEIPVCPYFHNCILNQDSGLMFYENKSIVSIDDNKMRARYILRMLNHHRIMLVSVTTAKKSSRPNINWSDLDKARNIYLLIHETKAGKPLSYLEKQMNSMMISMSKEATIKVLQFNIDYFTEQLKIARTQLKNDKIISEGVEAGHTNSNKDEYSLSRASSLGSESDNSCSMDSIPSSKSMDSGKNSCLRDCMALPQISQLGDSTTSLGQTVRKDSKDMDNKKRTKSKFGHYAGIMSSKRMVGDSLDMFSSKNTSRLDSEIGIYGFLKGGNTVPLVSDLMSGGERNNNKVDVYERLKFF